MHFGVGQFLLLLQNKTQRVLPYSSFAGIKMHGYSVYSFVSTLKVRVKYMFARLQVIQQVILLTIMAS